jgi:DNA-binding protein H-NS
VKELEQEVEKLRNAKPKPTYRSKKDRRLTWSGRGSMPRWMRQEIRELRLKPEAFLIAKRR